MKTIVLDIGGDGEQVETQLTIKGCSCRTEDFTMALIRFAKEWRGKGAPRPVLTKKPCGCKDKV
jgi:hypothetical protein